MDVTPLVSADAQVIQSYSADGFKVSGQAYQGAVFVDPISTQNWQLPDGKTASTLDQADFGGLINRAADIDVVLLGTGASIAFLPPALRQSLKASGLNIEMMDTGAACRTYNVLMAEGRRVVAALLPL